MDFLPAWPDCALRRSCSCFPLRLLYFFIAHGNQLPLTAGSREVMAAQTECVFKGDSNGKMNDCSLMSVDRWIGFSCSLQASKHHAAQ